MQNTAIELGPSAQASARLPALRVVSPSASQAAAPAPTTGSPYATGPWKMFWAFSGLCLSVLVIAQIALRLNVEYTL